MASTVQRQLHKLALIVAPRTPNGQVVNDATAALTVNAASNATPIVMGFTTNHGLQDGDRLYVASVGGNTAANNTGSNPSWVVTRVSASTLSLDGSAGNGAYTSGGTATPALIGSVDLEGGMTRQRLLDIYNFARLAFFDAMRTKFGDEKTGKECGALRVSTLTASFAASGANMALAKPAGYLTFEYLSNVSNVQIVLLDNDLAPTVREGVNPHYIQSASNIFVFDVGETLIHYGSTYVTAVSTYNLSYLGITAFTLSDVLGNSTTETFNEQYHQHLLELAQAIFDEQGAQQLNALALSLLGKG